MKALDLFCGAGGVSVGLQRAGFEVTGVDHLPMPHYRGGTFVQADALDYPLGGFDFIWASPPCQAYSALRHLQADKDYPGLIPETRARLVASGAPHCIENVKGAPLRASLTLCGSMFGLHVRRHRVFEINGFWVGQPPCRHEWEADPIDTTGTGGRRARSRPGPRRAGGNSRKPRSLAEAQTAMGIDWMPRALLSQAIPPAYAEWIGRQALAAILQGRNPA